MKGDNPVCREIGIDRRRRDSSIRSGSSNKNQYFKSQILKEVIILKCLLMPKEITIRNDRTRFLRE